MILSSLAPTTRPARICPGPAYIISSPRASRYEDARVALIPNCHTPDRLRSSAILSSLGLATFSPARKDLFLGAHGATSQGVTHPGIAPASNSLNFGVLTTPKPVSSQKASYNLDEAFIEAFWELTSFGFVGTPKLSELEAGAIPRWVTTLGSCFVSSQKQNRAGWNSEVKRVGGWSNPRMGDHPGKLLRELPETKP
ncbi:hypothetical protein L3X38_033561 [Prunus dulcis]|uniref:Uncharacterized protein n=1 Tax=Prunus dulcis TaxID=3755 RepID=A0AAD4YXR1_PRUDU|nr:hypothetical protein L3X38_033561 [Prunus dulcis]